MSVELMEFEGNPNIGLYSVLTDSIAIIPDSIPKKFSDRIEKVLKVKIFTFTVDPSVIGALMVVNEHGILLSSILSIDVEESLRETFPDLQIQRFDFDYLALGNLIVSTDKKTLISPLIPKKRLSVIEDTFNTEVIVTQLNNSNLVGSLVVTNSLGAVISPLIEQENEIQKLQEYLNVDAIDISTVNKGSRFPSTGILCNKNGVLLGKYSTGLETIAITNALFPS
jgi:translation initiation factor 6